MSHPSGDLDDIIHQRTRLGVMTVLCEVSESDFTFLRDTLGLSDGNLSRHLTVLADAGYVRITKGYQGRKPHTSVKATARGRRALDRYLTSLQDLIDRARSPESTDTTANEKEAAR